MLLFSEDSAALLRSPGDFGDNGGPHWSRQPLD